MKLKLNTIYNEHCLKTMRKLPDNYVDLIITSPPYDDLREYDGHKFTFMEFKLIAKAMYRVLKQDRILVWVVEDKTKKYNKHNA